MCSLFGGFTVGTLVQMMGSQILQTFEPKFNHPSVTTQYSVASKNYQTYSMIVQVAYIGK